MSHNGQNKNASDGTIVIDDYRIDRESQVILIRLSESDWTYSTNLRRTAELSQNAQVLYRMEEHLIPLGFVEEKERENERGSGYKERRQFRLTSEGAAWVDENEERVAVPKSRAETQKMVYEAKEAAESARESVQSYRQKVSRMGDDVDDIVEKLVAYMDEKDDEFGQFNSELGRLRRDQSRLSESFDALESDVGDIEAQHEKHVENMGERLGQQETAIQGLQEDLREMRERNKALCEEIEEMQRGRLDKFRDRFGDD